jgi:alpha-tubulin suppressor-like RCC1 family protein
MRAHSKVCFSSSTVEVFMLNSVPRRVTALFQQRGVFVALVTAAMQLAGCGGSGGSADAPASPTPSPTTPTVGASAKVVTPAAGKTAWGMDTPAAFSLTDSAGVVVAGALSCSSDSLAALTVAADCSSLKGTRLGNQAVTVSGGGISAKATVKVVPQAQPLGTHNQSNRYNLVVTPDGRVLAWGSNAGGRLGQGVFGRELSVLGLPTEVKSPSGLGPLTGIVACAAGGLASFGLTEEGEVFSWGGGYDLGRPYDTSVGEATLPEKVVSPTGGGTLQKIVSLSAGSGNVIALSDDGTVFYWGAGAWSGQLGAPDARAPVTVPGIAGRAVAVSAGLGWSAVLLEDGRVMTWGFQAGGNLGRGVIGDNETRTPGFVIDKNTGQPITGVVSIAAGGVHGLALLGTGQVYAWGANENGEVGQGEASGGRPDHPAATLVLAPGGASAWSGVKIVAAGYGHSLAIDNSGRVFSWGYSQDGQLGDGANHPRVSSSSLPAAVVSAAGFGQLSEVSAVAAGDDHSLALTNDGQLLIWGSNGSTRNLGQGDATLFLSYVPLNVKGETGSGSLALSPMSHWSNLTRRGIF